MSTMRVRNNHDAQPGKKLTALEWEELWSDYVRDRTVSVAALCQERGVSRARFYAKFSNRIKQIAPVSPPQSDPGA